MSMVWRMQSHNPLVHKRLLFLAGWTEARREKENMTGGRREKKVKQKGNNRKERGRGGKREKKFNKK